MRTFKVKIQLWLPPDSKPKPPMLMYGSRLIDIRLAKVPAASVFEAELKISNLFMGVRAVPTVWAEEEDPVTPQSIIKLFFDALFGKKS